MCKFQQPYIYVSCNNALYCECHIFEHVHVTLFILVTYFKINKVLEWKAFYTFHCCCSFWFLIYEFSYIQKLDRTLLIVEVTVVGQALDMGLHFILALYPLNEIVLIMDNGFISGQYCLRFIYMYMWQWDKQVHSWWKYIPLHIS